MKGKTKRLLVVVKKYVAHLYDNVYFASFGRNLNLLLNTRWPAKIALGRDSVYCFDVS